MNSPNPRAKYPMKALLDYDKLVFLNNFITVPNIHIGDYTYYDDLNGTPENFEKENVLYNHDPEVAKLVIGKFCAIAAETKFIVRGNHKTDCFSSYPFPIFGQGWEEAFPYSDFPNLGDINIGHDVWLGYNALVMAGVTIGPGSIIGTRAVVVKDVPPYSIVVGNPGRVVKQRFDDKTIERLLKIAWWDWNVAKITKHIKLICSLDIDALEDVA